MNRKSRLPRVPCLVEGQCLGSQGPMDTMHNGDITGYMHGISGHVVDLWWGRYNWWIKPRRG